MYFHIQLKNEQDEKFLKMQIFPAYGILYNDPELNPNISTTNFDLRYGWAPKNLLQQLYGEKRCFEMVEIYSKKHNINYTYLMRLRSDHELRLSIKDLPSIRRAYENIKNDKVVIPYDVYERTFTVNKHLVDFGHKMLSDRFGFGKMEKMKYYMMRYDYMNMKNLTTLHSESFLYFILSHYNVSIVRNEWSYLEINL